MNELFREKIRLLYQHAPQVLGGGLLAAFLLAAILYNRLDKTDLFIWLAAALFINGLRTLLVLSFRKINTRDFSAKRWGWLFALGSGCYGLLWGFGFYGFFKAESLELVLLTLVLAGMIAGSVAALSAFMPAYLAYVLGSAIPYIVRLWQEDGLLFQQIAELTVLFVLVNILYAFNAQSTLTGAIRIKLEKQGLAERLKRQMHETAEALALAEQANLERSRLLAATSHDLRQPLHAQNLFLDVLRRDLQGRPEIHLVHKAIEAGSALNDMLDSLLEISQIESGGVRPVVTEFPLAPILTRLKSEFLPQAHAKELRLSMPFTRAWCRSDPVLVERILRNLLINAVKYTQRGGIVAGVRPRGAHVLLQVWDSGIGIPEHQTEAIFIEFQQLANPERDRHKGLGLGLAIVKRLCGILEHPVRVSSIPGRGSVFEVQVPNGIDCKVEAPFVDPESQIAPGLSVLLVDDDVLIREAASLLFSRLPVRYWCAASPEAAYSIVENTPELDVLLVDYRLPNAVNGLDVIDKIQAKLNRRIPAAVVTGEITGDQLSGFPILQKPLQGQRFVTLLAMLGAQAINPPTQSNHNQPM